MAIIKKKDKVIEKKSEKIDKNKKVKTVKVKAVKPVKEKKVSKRKQKKIDAAKNNRSRNSYLAPVSGYDFSGSYIKAGKRYATILRVVNKYGMNRQMQFGWFVNLIPEVTEDGVKAYLFEADKPIAAKEQTNIFKNIIPKTIKAHGSQNDSKNETFGDRKIKDMMVGDLNHASKASATNQLLIESHLYVLLVGDDPDVLEEQLRKLNTLYSDHMNGVSLRSVGGSQETMFKNIFAKPSGDVYDYTWMSGDFAGNDHAVRKGLDDYIGAVPVGTLTNSYASGVANMSLDGTSGQRVLVAAYPESHIYGYDKDLSAASMWGQRIANNVMTNHHRVFHIVLNGFNYDLNAMSTDEPEERRFANRPILMEDMEYVDLSKGGLNPLEMFGDIEDLLEIYDTNQDKLVEMFYLMAGRSLDAHQRNDLKTELNDFYIGNQLWTTDAYKNPEKTRVLGIENHDTYLTMGDFIGTLSNNLQNARLKGGTQTEQDNAKLLMNTLKNALDSYRGIFNETTTLRDPKDVDKSQIYYDLSRLRNNSNIQEAQFLNAFDYIAHAAQKGDMIMIHGMDRLSLGTLQVIQARLNKVTEKGVRFAYLFDAIGNGKANKTEGLSSEQVKNLKANIFNTDGLLYQNLDQQFGYTILGTMNADDLEIYQRKVKQKLTLNLKETLTATGATTQFQIRRPADMTTVLIHADFIV